MEDAQPSTSSSMDTLDKKLVDQFLKTQKVEEDVQPLASMFTLEGLGATATKEGAKVQWKLVDNENNDDTSTADNDDGAYPKEFISQHLDSLNENFQSYYNYHSAALKSALHRRMRTSLAKLQTEINTK